jgi:orotate phosphoribosyltransferase
MSKITTSFDVPKMMLEAQAVASSIGDYYHWSAGGRSPIYADHRILISDVDRRRLLVEAFIDGISALENKPDIVVGVATGGIPYASWVSWEMSIPLSYVRTSKKTHGKENQVEGRVSDGMSAVVIEDAFTTGASSIKVIQALKSHGVNVQCAMSILNNNVSVLDVNFNEAGTRHASMYTFADLLNEIRAQKYFPDKVIREIENWIVETGRFKVECFGIQV